MAGRGRLIRRPSPQGAEGGGGRRPRLVTARLPGAILRAVAVALAIGAPTVALGIVGAGAWEAGLIAAAVAGIMVLLEYGAATPALVDFRFAPPVNRLRFALVCLTLAPVTAFVAATEAAGGGPSAVRDAGLAFGAALGGPFSPVGLATELLRRPSALAPDPMLRAAAALTLSAAGFGVLVFGLAIWFGRWPGPADRFNRWTNLPTFETADEADVADRLARLGAMVVITGLALPGALLVLGGLAVASLAPDALASPTPLVWAAAVWAAAPGVVLLRGIALLKLARVLRAQEGEAA